MSEFRQLGLGQLEQKCVKPGYWEVEGYTVRRSDAGWWHVSHVDANGALRPRGRYRTLRECREHIYELVHE